MKDVLTREFAKKRSEEVSNVSYELALIFKKGSKTYSGKCKIRFSLKKNKEPLKVDLISKNVISVKVNGKPVEYKKDEFSVAIKQRFLKTGLNEMEVEYENDYDYTGSGLHHFIDPEDEEEYLYSNFEPYSAHRMFPCFDQPDIKATYELTVTAPENWAIISNTFEKSSKTSGQKITTEFKKTQKFSTYLFHVSAGPYEIFEDDFNGMKLRIMCRKALKKYVKEKEMFLITKQGLGFYSKYFNFPYPFEKYDQIYVPEFNHGAMENVGAVTFSEQLIKRYIPTRTERSILANVILHEMVHMWFGDLVTMRWWDDLWLNESFADFLSYVGLSNATEFKDAWNEFYARKAWAYYQDQLITTHPIAADAGDTDIAFSNFDGISYAKGASVLKQLMFYIGEDAFKKGVQDYFKKFQWKNTELKDFRECLQKAAGKSLKNWFEMWIESEGVNSAEPIYQVKAGKLEKLAIKQHPFRLNGVLRLHKTKLALFYDDGKSCKIGKEIDTIYTGSKTVINGISGTKRPDLLYLNYEDHDYIKDVIDEKSVNYLLQNIERIGDQLTKNMLYGSLWQMVRDAELDPKKYLELVYNKAPIETDQLLLERMFLRVTKILGSYTRDENYRKYCEKFYELAWKNIQRDISVDNKKAWFDLIVSTSSGVKSIDKLVQLMNGKIKIKDFEFSQEDRWEVLTRMAVIGHKDTLNILKKEKQADKSDKGQKAAITVEASLLDRKDIFWKIFLDGKKSLDYTRNGMQGFYWRRQKKELEKYIGMFFDSIINIFKAKDRYYSQAFFNNLFPSMYVDDAIVKKTKKFLDDNPKMPKLLRKDFLESLDELERSLKILKTFN